MFLEFGGRGAIAGNDVTIVIIRGRYIGVHTVAPPTVGVGRWNPSRGHKFVMSM